MKGLEADLTPKKSLSPFGKVGASHFGAAASVLLPSAFMKEMPKRPALQINTSEMITGAEPNNKLSVVQDLESVLECDTIKDEASVRTPALTPSVSIL